MSSSEGPKKKNSIAGILFTAFCLLSATTMSDTVITDMIVFKTCVVTLKIPESECEILHTNSTSDAAKSLLEIIHPEIATLLALKFLIEVPLPTILSLFLGPWSDKFGRKPLFLLPFTGLFLDYLSLMIFSQTNLNPYFFLISSTCVSIFGGGATLLVVFVCYTSDVSDSEKKAWNLCLVDMYIGMGALAGLTTGPWIFQKFGYLPVFTASTTICLTAWLFAAFCLRETIQYKSNENRLKHLFNPLLVKELVIAVTKKRENFDRTTVWCCILCLLAQLSIVEGGGSIGFLFSSARLGWNVADYAIFTTTSICIAIIGYIFTLRVAGPIIGISYPLIVFFASILELCGSTIRAFTYLPWHFYVAPIFGMFSTSAVPIMKTIIVKNIPETDIGKVFSLVTSMTMMIPMVSNPLYLLIYTNFMPPKYYPCPVWFLPSIFCGIIMFLSLTIEKRSRLQRREPEAAATSNE